LRSARHIVAISARGKSEIETLYGTAPVSITVVYNGVDLARFHPDNRPRWRDEMRTSLGIPAEAWLIAFVGSGFERKGLGPLLDAVARLGDRRVRVLVAGKGRTEAYREMAARLGVADAVTWVAPRPDVERIYATADVVALPARYEPFGNVHLEALASGVPVLTSAATGRHRGRRSGVSGAVVARPLRKRSRADCADCETATRTGSGWPRARRPSPSPMRRRWRGSRKSIGASPESELQ
jgi:UDP-glucose:(heptosyl)LPS alpha-1,3-glucosyltransferase